MGGPLKFDYYYGVEAEQFSFYRVPRLLIKDECFRGLSSDAKLLYGLMLDRMALSMKNGWIDEENRAYIYYTLDNIMEDLGCAREKCSKVLAELDSKKGIGLIRKKRQGLGKPDMIYVMNFAAIQPEKEEEKAGGSGSDTDVSAEVRKSNFKKFENQTSRSSETELQEIRKSNFKKFENQTSASSETEPQEVRLPNPNYNNTNYNDQSHTDMSYTNPINQSAGNADRPGPQEKADAIDMIDETNAYMALIRENLEYEHHMKYDHYGDKEIFEEIYETVCDVVCVKRKAIRINGEDYPYELVKSRFLKLNSSHAEYVMGCMRETATKITNIRAYLITALYNAPSTMSHYYQQEVQHDMYGGIWENETG